MGPPRPFTTSRSRRKIHPVNADAELADLPSPPRALAAVIRAARSADVSLETLGKLVGADPGFAVRVLKVANSPIYGQRSRISSVRRAP